LGGTHAGGAPPRRGKLPIFELGTNAVCYHVLPIFMTIRPTTIALVLLSTVATSCFNPPVAQEPADSKTSVVVPLPFDLTWTAVTDVIKLNDYRIQAQDPNHGILEVLGHRFTLQDADCGKIESIAGTYAAEPESNATAVYNFRVTPVSNESTRVGVQASYDSPLRVPLHPYQDVQCVSRGAAESHLLQQVLAQVRVTHPPAYRKPGAPTPTPSAPALAPGRPTLLRPEMLPKSLSE
jgi:hypothetical protein